MAAVALSPEGSLTCTGPISATPVAWALGYPTSSVVFMALGAIAVLVLHRGNIARLLAGRENRIELGRGRRTPRPPEPRTPA